MRFAMPRWGWYAIGAALLVLAFYVALDRYGDARFDAGKATADKEWKEAGDRLVAKAQNAATKADAAAAGRVADHMAQVADEKERIDAATKDGASPFDVMFGNAG